MASLKDLSIDLSYPLCKIDTVMISTDMADGRYQLAERNSEILGTESTCIVCASSSYACKGLFCEVANHFQCDDCITSWMKALNVQQTEAPDMLRARGGLLNCVSPDCPSSPFKASVICMHINDVDVLEGFLQCLTHTHTLRIQEEYQEQLSKQLASLGGAPPSAGSEKNKVELEALAQNLRLTMRNPRMCRQCNYGPVENIWCDDLQCHHGDVMQENQRTVNNACPKCGWFTESWNSWLPWDGNLPEEMRGGIEITAARRVPTRMCRYFARGQCRHGDACNFLHVSAEEAPQVQRQEINTPARRQLRPRPERIRHPRIPRATSPADDPLPPGAPAQRSPQLARLGRQRCICIHFASAEGCFRGDNCHFQHVQSPL